MLRNRFSTFMSRLAHDPAPRAERDHAVPMAAALQTAERNRRGRSAPGGGDPRIDDGLIFPGQRPKFALRFGEGVRVFTIGSCFARNIEAELMPLGVDLPTRRFAPPKSEYPNRPSGLLNEFNPGAVARRILDAFAGAASPAETIVAAGSGFSDLLLVGGADVTYDRAVERRGEIAEIYRALPGADVTIVTLGLAECWFDRQTDRYLNRAPPFGLAATQPDRFLFRVLSVAQSFALLEPAFQRLADAGMKTIVSVSPVPLSVTFTPNDATVSDCYSKSVLRVCAEELARTFPNVDYFPSYEIVKSGGLSAYEEDGIHVRREIVARVTRWMVDRYTGPAATGPA